MWPFGSRKRAARQAPTGDPDQLLNQRVVLLQGPLTEEQATQAIAQMLFLQHQDPRQPITLLIDSVGGSVTAGMAVIETIKELTPPLRTRCDGGAHGMAAAILASGNRGERLVVCGSSVSLTPITAGESGAPEPDMQQARQLVAGVIATGARRSVESVAADLVTGRHFDPAGAVNYGLADRVVE